MKSALIFILVIAAISCHVIKEETSLRGLFKIKTCDEFVSEVRKNEELLSNGGAQDFDKECEEEHICADLKLKVHKVLSMAKRTHPNKKICWSLYPNSTFEYINFPSNQSVSVECTACKLVVEAIKFDINVLNFSSSKIREIVEDLCDLLAPFKVQKELCHVIVESVDKITKWVLNGITPGNICERIKLCTNETLISDRDDDDDSDAVDENEDEDEYDDYGDEYHDHDEEDDGHEENEEEEDERDYPHALNNNKDEYHTDFYGDGHGYNGEVQTYPDEPYGKGGYIHDGSLEEREADSPSSVYPDLSDGFVKN